MASRVLLLPHANVTEAKWPKPNGRSQVAEAKDMPVEARVMEQLSRHGALKVPEPSAPRAPKPKPEPEPEPEARAHFVGPGTRGRDSRDGIFGRLIACAYPLRIVASSLGLGDVGS